MEGLSEKLKRAFASAGVNTSFKPLTTLRKVLVSPKDKTALEKQSGVIYSIKCKDCDSLYIGESGRKLEKRLAEHKSKAATSKSAIREHVEHSKGHNIDWENVKVLEREPKDFPRKILEGHPNQDPEPKIEQRQRAGIRPSLGQSFSHQGVQGAKWKFFSDVANIYDVR